MPTIALQHDHLQVLKEILDTWIAGGELGLRQFEAMPLELQPPMLAAAQERLRLIREIYELLGLGSLEAVPKLPRPPDAN